MGMTVIGIPAGAAGPDPGKPPPDIQLLAGNHRWVVYGLYDWGNGMPEQAVDVIANDSTGTAESLPQEFGDYRTAVSLVRDLLTAVQADIPDQVLWVDLETGATGVSKLPPDSVYIASSADGWLAITPQGLVDINRSGDTHLIDADPPRDGRYRVSDRGFTMTVDDAVTYRTWAHPELPHVFKPEMRDGERLFCSDLSAKAIECSMDREYCPSWGCDDEPRVHHRPYYIPLTDGPPIRSPLLGTLFGRSVTPGRPLVDADGRFTFSTWHAGTGKVTTARVRPGEFVEIIGRAWGRLILQHFNNHDGPPIDRLIAATPDLTKYRPIVCSPAPC